jgi:hypothetical protein
MLLASLSPETMEVPQDSPYNPHRAAQGETVWRSVGTAKIFEKVTPLAAHLNRSQMYKKNLE